MINILILDDIEKEMARQEEKWGLPDHHPERWLAIITEEVGEVARAAIVTDFAQMQLELVQVAAVCVHAIAQLEHHKD